MMGFYTNNIRCCSIALAMALGLHINAKCNATDFNSLIFTEVCVANIDQTIDYSNNYGSWVEVYNPTDFPISLDGWYISDDVTDRMKHRLEGYGVLNPGCYECIFFGHNAADGEYGVDAGKQVRFKLDRSGGVVYLSPDGSDAGISVVYPPSVARCSYALIDLGDKVWSYCGLPTPNAANAGHYAQTCLDAPKVDCDSRLFTEEFTVQATVPTGTTLLYTLDGSTPTLSNGMTSTDGRFEISQTTVLRLRLFADGFLPSGVVTRTYIYKDREYYLPIVAVSTDPRNLYDSQIGCYVNGDNGIIGRGSKVASNLNMDWERPVNFEYLTADGRMVINQESSFEVAGGYSRHFEPASFKLQAKKLYDGNGSFAYPVFAGKPYCKYKQLLIRNGGNNNRTDGGSRIKDAIAQQVLTSSGYYVDAQEYQPVHVFVNGKYLAMMNVREPNNRFHGSANYGYDDDEMDGFEYSNGAYSQRGGTKEAFDKLISLSREAGTDEGYAKVCELLDMEEFVRYMATICYTGSYDWLLNGNNVKGYRSRDDGRFHFVLFDLDFAFERTNNVELIGGVVKSNEVLTLYRNLRRNGAFCRQFVSSYSILHGSIYTPERCKYIADSICNLVQEALSFDRRYTLTTYDRMRDEMWGQHYREERIKSLRRAYNLMDSINVVINTNNAVGRVRLEGQTLPLNCFSGVLFGYESVMAEPAEGYKFVGWKNQDGKWIGHDKECRITGDGTYTAVYDMMFNESISPICINEVSAGNDIFVNDYGKRADWIELYNRGKEPIDVAELYFSDDASEPMKYQLDVAPETNTVLMPDGHIVVWCDGKPSMTQPHLPFKLKNVDNGFLSVHSADRKWMDTFAYDVHSPKETVGRYPDGGKSCYVFYHPTIGNHNMITMYDSAIKPVPASLRTLASSDDIASVVYYTIDGKKVRPNNGIYIMVIRYRDGHSDVNKILIRDRIITAQ
ncbi:MAG: CotH kinase family protein [Bacteroidaceae bacterium]|nr:CotH kinase family protein [Bacteroidaceae bacterium]